MFKFNSIKKIPARIIYNLIDLIPSSINHFTHSHIFRLQHFVSPSTYIYMSRSPTRVSLEIYESVNVKALIGDGINSDTGTLISIDTLYYGNTIHDRVCCG